MDEHTPVVVITHMNHDSITNKPEFVTALEGKNVVLIIGGHYEEPRLQHFGGGYNWVQLGSPRNGELRTINAFRITDDLVTSTVWDIEAQDWIPQFTVNQAITTPEAGTAGACLIAAGALIGGRRPRRQYGR